MLRLRRIAPGLLPDRDLRIDWQNPISHGLIAAYPLTSPVGIRGLLAGHESTEYLDAGAQDNYLFAPGVGQLYDFDGNVTLRGGAITSLITGESTVAAWVDLKVNTITNVAVAIGTAGDTELRTSNSANGVPQFLVRYGGGWHYTTATSPSSYLKGPQLWVGRWRSGDELDIWVNGEFFAVDSSVATADATFTGTQIHIGGRVAANQWVGRIGHVLVWNRKLSADEVRQLWNDPGCQYVRDESIAFIPEAAPPTGRIMSSLVNAGGLAGHGGIAGQGGGLAA